MSFLDAAFDIGKSLVGSVLGGDKGGGGNTVVAPQYNSLMTPLEGAKGTTSHTERRSMDPTQRAETQKEKERGAGDDPIQLALMWGDFLKDIKLDG